MTHARQKGLDRLGSLATRREGAVLATVLVLYAAVFVLRLVVDGEEVPASLLYALPIALVATEYGAKLGLMSAGVAFALFAIYARIDGQDINLLGWATRGLVFFLLGGLLGRFADRLRATQGALEANRSRLQGILDNTTAVVYLKDLDGRYLLVNQRFERLFGVTQGQATGKTDYDLFPKYAADAFRAADRKVLKAREAIDVEEVAPHRDGPHTYVSVKFPVFDEDGEPCGVCGISTDITARISAEQLVRESRERFRQIIDTAHEAFISIDADGVTTAWNREAEETFGWPRSQALGRPLHDLVIPPRYRERHVEGLRHHAKTGEAPFLNRRIELVAVHRDGREFPIEITITAVKTRKGVAFNAFLHDISERKRIEELARAKSGLERYAAELRRSNMELAQFAHVASHDLSEPLHAVSRHVQLLDKRYRGRLDPDADEMIGYAVEGATRMQALVEALRAYSTLGSQEHRPETAGTDDVVARAVESLRPELDASDASVIVDDLPVVSCDPDQLQTVFEQLIANAVKFSGERSPEIGISAERTPEGWCFSVADNGIGVKPEHAERIFEMFQRLHRRGEYPGTGIGLTLARKIAVRHGGRIWVEPCEGGGSCFRFTIADEQAVASEAVVPAGDGATPLPS